MKCEKCQIDLSADDTCPKCGVYHGEPCADCDRRGYHAEGCPEVDCAEADAEVQAPGAFIEGLVRGEPFCACGRVFSRCDGSRAGCRKK
jgi:hypothetical protein